MMSSTLSPTTDATHHRLDSTEWDDIYITGAIHGCHRTFYWLLYRHNPGLDDLVVFVGDLVKKGPDSKAVLDLVSSTPNFHCVRGNNEQRLMDGRKSIDTLTESDLTYLASLHVITFCDDVAVVHGDIDHRQPVVEHTFYKLLTTRSLASNGSYDCPHWFKTSLELPQVSCRHTVVAEPFESGYMIGLDTSCIHDGRLTAHDYRAGRFIAVEQAETHVPQSAGSVVEPRVQHI